MTKPVQQGLPLAPLRREGPAFPFVQLSDHSRLRLHPRLNREPKAHQATWSEALKRISQPAEGPSLQVTRFTVTCSFESDIHVYYEDLRAAIRPEDALCPQAIHLFIALNAGRDTRYCMIPASIYLPPATRDRPIVPLLAPKHGYTHQSLSDLLLNAYDPTSPPTHASYAKIQQQARLAASNLARQLLEHFGS